MLDLKHLFFKVYIFTRRKNFVADSRLHRNRNSLFDLKKQVTSFYLQNKLVFDETSNAGKYFIKHSDIFYAASQANHQAIEVAPKSVSPTITTVPPSATAIVRNGTPKLVV